MEAHIIEVIRVIDTVGKGTKKDPVRVEVGYFTKDGAKLAQMNINDDPYSPLRQQSAP